MKRTAYTYPRSILFTSIVNESFSRYLSAKGLLLPFDAHSSRVKKERARKLFLEGRNSKKSLGDLYTISEVKEVVDKIVMCTAS